MPQPKVIKAIFLKKGNYMFFRVMEEIICHTEIWITEADFVC